MALVRDLLNLRHLRRELAELRRDLARANERAEGLARLICHLAERLEVKQKALEAAEERRKGQEAALLQAVKGRRDAEDQAAALEAVLAAHEGTEIGEVARLSLVQLRERMRRGQ